MSHSEQQIQLAAKTCHIVNRAYCAGLGDNSQPSWDDAPKWQRDSAINGVRAILANPQSTPEHSHENWLAHKKEAGWKYGPVKDPDKKEHPCCVPYAQLPSQQKQKDVLFDATARGVLGL